MRDKPKYCFINNIQNRFYIIRSICFMFYLKNYLCTKLICFLAKCTKLIESNHYGSKVVRFDLSVLVFFGASLVYLGGEIGSVESFFFTISIGYLSFGPVFLLKKKVQPKDHI